MSSRRNKSLPDGSCTAGTRPDRAHRRNVCSLQVGIMDAASAAVIRSADAGEEPLCRLRSLTGVNLALSQVCVK